MNTRRNADLMAMNLKEQLQRIHALGAQKFVVVETGPVGCCPAQRDSNTEECNDGANSLSVLYNEALKSMLQQLKLALGINYTLFDTYTVLTNIAQNAASYGVPTLHQAQLASRMNVVVVVSNALLTVLSERSPSEEETHRGLWVLEPEDKAASHYEVQIGLTFNVNTE